jgi:hypothetical protein
VMDSGLLWSAGTRHRFLFLSGKQTATADVGSTSTKSKAATSRRTPK